MAKSAETGGKIVHDADLKAMSAISKAMQPLDDETREEVVAWFSRKYMTAKPDAPKE